MKKTVRRLIKVSVRSMSALALCLTVALGTSTGVRADEEDAKRLLKAMTDYLTAQMALSFGYDAILEVVTHDEQRLALASSGTVTINRPDKIRATRATGFANVESSFDGKTLTVVDKALNHYAQIHMPGTIDFLVDELKNKYHKPLPAADVMMSNAYNELMLDVVDVKDLGSGMIGGVECDHLAFRKDEVDWQIWIAQGEYPYPCRYVIVSKLIAGVPQYSIQVSDWKTGSEVAAIDFSFSNPTNAEKLEMKDLEGIGDLPKHFVIGDAQ